MPHTIVINDGKNAVPLPFRTVITPLKKLNKGDIVMLGSDVQCETSYCEVNLYKVHKINKKTMTIIPCYEDGEEVYLENKRKYDIYPGQEFSVIRSDAWIANENAMIEQFNEEEIYAKKMLGRYYGTKDDVVYEDEV